MAARVGSGVAGTTVPLEEPGPAFSPRQHKRSLCLPRLAEATPHAIVGPQPDETACSSRYLNVAVTVLAMISVTVQLSVSAGQVVVVTLPPHPVNV